MNDDGSGRDLSTEGNRGVVPVLIDQVSPGSQSNEKCVAALHAVTHKALPRGFSDGFTHVPADSKSEGVINITGTELRNTTWERQPGCHFSQALHHAEDSDTRQGITKKNGERTSLGERATDTQEETSSDRSTQSDELDVSGLEAVRSGMSAVSKATWYQGHYPRTTYPYSSAVARSPYSSPAS